MSQKPIYIGEKKASFSNKEVKGSLGSLEGETYYKITNNDSMRPFFMSLVSNSNHWMFVASNGGLTAGRKDSNNALFPYYTDDKITESFEITGSKTLLQIHKADKTFLWEPFSDNYAGVYKTQRNLYKNSWGNKLIFEEVNEDLGLTFRYQWSSSDRFGFVKKATLRNDQKEAVQVSILDGLQNLLPYGLNSDMQNNRSNLVDAYKKSELLEASGLGIYSLSSVIVDRAEPSEALKANIAWSVGLETPSYLICSKQIQQFREGKELEKETEVRAEKSAYFVNTTLDLAAGSEKTWMLVANVNQGPSDVVAIAALINSEINLFDTVLEDVAEGTRELIELNATADGIQLTADPLRDTRHFANVLFNNMRGGIFDHNYQIEQAYFTKYVRQANLEAYTRNQTLLEGLPETLPFSKLKTLAVESKDSDFERLTMEYLPLKFSRRHGDPSRPWNKFSINTKSEIDGSKILDYEGNWRDIFQNWETLAHAYPEFIENMIHKFLNATTFEGYNPYRVTKDGFDWETIEPDDAWSFIGYWGDHQIVYLLKFLEFIENHQPDRLAELFDKDLFVYANVPYKIKSYAETLKDPKDTISFDDALDQTIRNRKDELGADGALLRAQNNTIYKVNGIEKLLATVLSKISNFIPEGGIWMNTQRPEWNDANNALVGNGVSMVTLYYLRRFLKFFEKTAAQGLGKELALSSELAEFFKEIHHTFEQFRGKLDGKITDRERKQILDGLGKAGSTYRTTIYNSNFSGDKTQLPKSELLQFLKLALDFLDHTIAANKRADNLYHSYNLMSLTNDEEIRISNLPEMLEGQVAILGSNCISSEKSLALLDALKASALYRKDQYSFVLYPDKQLPIYIHKNTIPAKDVENSALLSQLVKEGNTQILEQDLKGVCHFNGNFNNANSLKEALGKLPKQFQRLVEKDNGQVFNTFENLFDHKSFTGRSGTFFGYEGLGSIYWHMVSKLLLATQETALTAIQSKESKEVVDGLVQHYFEINDGIGVHKSPELYGAFPTDPYSHTPAGKGAQQPGMTGQVKEDVLSRFGELGIAVKEGKLGFNIQLLKEEAFLKTSEVFSYIDVHKEAKKIPLKPNSLCFTYCQIPIVFQLADKEGIEVQQNSASVVKFDSLQLDKETSNNLFERNGKIEQLVVSINKSSLR